MENKKSFFTLTLNIEDKNDNEFYLDNLNTSMDLILTLMKVSSNCYKFEQINKTELIYLFQTDTRKRQGQLVRLCEKNFDKEQIFTAVGVTKFVFDREIERLKQNKYFTLKEEPAVFSDYSGDDIKFFNTKENWHPWQEDLYKEIMEQDGSFKKPDGRKIISLVDKTGNSGKSSFFKWLFFNHPEKIGRLGYGSASQLRSSAINIGKKELYIVDLARSKSKQDKEEDLLSVIEDLKSGLVTNAMYGSGKTLMMTPPHIIISSNYVLNYDLLSADRWKLFEINRNKKLKVFKKGKPPLSKKY